MITTSADHGRAAVQQALVVAEEPEGDTRYRFIYSDQRKPCPAASRGARLLLCVPFAGLLDLAPASGAVRSRSEPHAALWAPAPRKPLETTGERGANGAPPVRRVAPRTDLSNARS